MNQNNKGIWKVIGASSVGTLIEWYDFYIFGSLATVIANQFFPKQIPRLRCFPHLLLSLPVLLYVRSGH
jgi:hypothetical protein